MSSSTALDPSSIEVLIAEDSPTQAERLKYTLERHGYRVTSTVNGRLALEAARARKPTVVISDVIMPEMSGYELCRSIKSDPTLADVPVILVTTLADPQDVIRGLECRADNFIIKPYDEHYLLSRIQFVLQNERIREPGPASAGVDIFFNGQQHTITADRSQILNLLLSTYEAAIQRNQEAVGMTQEIAMRKMVEQDLRKAHDELAVAKDAAESANRAKDQFLAILSHELRTPLTPVLALVSHLQTQRDLPEDLRDDLGMIRRNVEMEARLIDDLLDLTRIIRNKMELHYEQVDAHAAVRRSLELFVKPITEKKLNVKIDLQAEDFHLRADPSRLQQIFMNLLSNAVKFTAVGGQISIRSTNPTPGRIQFLICDDGIGVEPDVLPRLFTYFTQGERTVTRQYAGLGLGLSIAKSLVEMHQGTIAISSDGRDKGTTLCVDLPTTPAETLSPEVVTQAPAEQAPIVGPARHVLLVEDHHDTRNAMARLLKYFGCAVVTAGSVKEAMSLADRENFQLLVSDIGLPDGTGIDVVRHIKARYPIVAIAVSGFGNEDDIQRSLDAGFQMHMTKPVNVTTLRDAIDKLAG